MAAFVCSSLIRTPRSSWSSVPATNIWPGDPGFARGEIPDFVIRKRWKRPLPFEGSAHSPRSIFTSGETASWSSVERCSAR